MFSYYGSKSKLVHLYPSPVYDTIIEPFCGAAHYSLRYPERNVVLYDAYEIVARVWKYLIQASEQDILSLPDFTKGDKVTDHAQLIDEERWLLGFIINHGCESPKITCTEWGAKTFDGMKRRIASTVPKIKHWRIYHGSYLNIPHQQATWFIDPPYVQGGERYKVSGKKIDYSQLADWCTSREGQIIVCENSSASWLPFVPLREFKGQRTITTEVVFTR